MAGDTSVDMMLNVLPGTFTGIFALNAGLSSINQVFQNMTKNVDTHFGLLEAGVVSLTALTTQFAKGAADAFGQYEQGMKIVQAVSGQSASAIAELGQKANQFSVEYRMDIDQLTEGLQTLGRAGLKSAQEQAEVLENGLETAKLEGRDLNSVLQELIQNTTLLGGNLKSSSFGEQTDYVNDLLVATSMTAPINTHDISETLKYSGGMLAAGGGTITDEAGNPNEEGKKLIEDYMGTVAAFAQKGVTGSIAGTALRAFFNKPATQDTSVTEALAKIHLKPEYLWEEGEEQMKPVSEQIGLIQSQMDKLDISQMDRLQIWSKIVGGKMGQQMIKLDSSDIKEITKDIQEANSAENLATQSMQTYQAAMKQTSEAGQHAFRAFGEHVARFLKPIAQTLTPILEMLSNPVASTALFSGFLMLLGRAWTSIKQIVTGIRAEITLLKASLQSLVMNQPARKQVMGGRLHGGGTVVGYNQEQEPPMRTGSTVPGTTKVVGSQTAGMNQALMTMSTRVNDIYRVMTATTNRIKEEVQRIYTLLNQGITTSSQKVNQTITTASTRIKGEFGNAVNQVTTSFNTRMNRNISSSATRMRSEFQAALNSLTYTPKIKPTQMGTAAGLTQQKVDTRSPSYMFLQNTQRDAHQAEAAYQQRLTDLEKRRGNVLLSRQVGGSIDSSKNERDRATKHLRNSQTELGKVVKQIDSQNKIIENANRQLSKNYNSLTMKQKEELTVQKMNAEAQRESLLEKELLLKEEITYKKEEIQIHNSIIMSLRQLKSKIDAERLSLLKGRGTTGSAWPGSVGVLPGVIPAVIPSIGGTTTNPPDFTAKGYGLYTSQKSMPFVPGMFNWSNVPKEYHPNYGGTGNYVPWKFNTNAKEGHALLATLRQEEIAMTREMARTLGITDKELIVFYERLLQLNAAMGRTTTIHGGKVTSSAGIMGEQAYQEKIARDSLYRTRGSMVPIYSSGGTGHPTERDMRGLRALFGTNNGPSAEAFAKEFKDSRDKINKNLGTYENTAKDINKSARSINEVSRYTLAPGIYSGNQINSGLGRVPSDFGQAGGAVPFTVTRGMIDETVKMQETTLKQRIKGGFGRVWGASGAGNILKGTTSAVKGLGGALGKVTSFMGGPFFAGMMAVDIAMQIWNSAYQKYAKKVEEATQSLEDSLSRQSEAEQIFLQGQHEEGKREFEGWTEQHPDATPEEKEDALLGAYNDIYDNASMGLSALDENTQQLAIATQEVKLAGEKIEGSYLDGSLFAGNGPFNKSDANRIAMGNTDIWDLFNGGSPSVDKTGEKVDWNGRSYFTSGEILLSEKQQAEDYPWLKEFAPIFASNVWKTGDTKDSLRGMFGNAGYAELEDQITSIGGWDKSAWTRHGYNVNKYFGTDTEQNKLQMGLKNYQKDFSKLAKQTRRFEKATGSTALGAFNKQFKKTGDIKKTLKNLSIQDPKLTSYIKSLSIKTGMSAQQVLLAAQLQQLQEMQAIAKDQVTPRMENLVMSSYDQVAYGKQTLGTVTGSGDGAISAAQNAAAIAALLNAQMESKLDEQSYKDYKSHFGIDQDKARYKSPEEFAGAVNYAMNHPEDKSLDWLRVYGEKKMVAYAATNAKFYNPNLSEEQAKKMGQDWYDEAKARGASGNAMYDTLRTGGTTALKNAILAGYDAALDDTEGSGSGGGGSGSGSGNKDKDSGTRKERVDLVLCNKKEIPKLNVNLFKKPPTFTVLNKNFKLRDVKINTEDKPKAIMASIKNAFIDVQKRSDPKIIQDEEAEYDPVAATDGNALPSGSSKPKTNNNS